MSTPATGVGKYVYVSVNVTPAGVLHGESITDSSRCILYAHMYDMYDLKSGPYNLNYAMGAERAQAYPLRYRKRV